VPLQGTAAVYATAVSIGMLHGLEPGHGWPVAAVFALRKRHRWWYGIWAAVILGVAHLTSSFVVVAVYAAANHIWELDSLTWMNYVAGGLLLLMAIRQWRSGGHGHHHHPHEGSEDRAAGDLLGLVGFAFALGFVHEEEFAIIALAVGKANAWFVMGAYALAVAVSLVILTVLAIATLHRFQSKLHRYEHRLPRVSAVILGVMGLAYIFRLL
jgi:ABC-type nickel/cobalt efflux system permease component RcnA